MKYIILFLFIFFLNNLLIMLYCILSKRHDSKFFQKNFYVKTDKDYIPPSERKNRKTIIYEFVNSYLSGWVRLNIIYVGKIPSYRLRKIFYKYIFRMKISKKAVIFAGNEFRSPWNIVIGNAVIGNNCILDGRRGIIIGDNVVFGGNVRVWTEEHNINDPWFRVLPQNAGRVIIKDYAWICSDSTVLPNITIEKGAVIASRACVTKDCNKYTVYGGVPAKKISSRNTGLKYQLEGKPTYHFY